ncbi:MAG TPA: coenzyme F420-0:L-glutamate ligase, partial [Acetomicrobium flavidum]|nr:coenzyme F420-0:L-glutamate ligase [Acetomicrobium flavidum]
KYLIDSELDRGKSNAVEDAVLGRILQKKRGISTDKEESLGTTPRMYTDLIGSLCDLVSGSGDKGTPIVLVQGYFDDYTKEW